MSKSSDEFGEEVKVKRQALEMEDLSPGGTGRPLLKRLVDVSTEVESM